MAVTLTVDENSYISLSDAEDYFESRLNSNTWDDATDTEKKKALITATKHIDYYRFIGEKYDVEQKLKFPREYFNNISFFDESINGLTDGEKPQELLDATCEEAIALLDLNNKLEKKQKEGVKSESIGDASRNYSEDMIKRKINSRELVSSEAKSLLRGFIKSSVKLC